MKIFIGYDHAEAEAYRVAVSSIRRHASRPVDITPLNAERLSAAGVLDRVMDNRGGLFDLRSGAPCATEFAISRFVTPILAQSGLALFVDCDVVALGDVYELEQLADRRFAVQVVKHNHVPTTKTKMSGAHQTRYPRKNWSSVMLFNCEHPANRRLSLHDVNTRPGRDLHAFYWLNDDEIGELPPRWNWLVGEQTRPANTRLAHFTLGGPWLPNWKPAEHDDLWQAEADA